MPAPLPLRWTGSLPAGDLSPLNCMDGGAGTERLPLLRDAGKVHRLTEAQWPSVRMTRRGTVAESGPTGAPWVNANGWMIRLALFREPARMPWVDTKPPASARPEEYVLAASEAMVYGGSWIVTHTPESWSSVQKALRFFVARGAEADWQPVASLGVMNVNDAFGEEYLNLAARRQIGYRISKPADLDPLPAAIWLGNAPPWDDLLPWIRRGGTLVVNTTAAPRAEGKGRIVAPREPWSDPYLAVVETHLALTRKADVLRMWNGGSLQAHYTASADRKRGVVHLVNYAARAASNDISIWLSYPWKHAVLKTFDATTVLKAQAVHGGMEVPLPGIGVYAAIELEA